MDGMISVNGKSGPTITKPTHQVQIRRIAGRYLIFDVEDVVYLRRHQNISSVFVGTLPQAPSQSLVLGLPIELFAEEAKLLVERDVAYVVDDAAAHFARLRDMGGDAKERYFAALQSRRNDEYASRKAENARKQVRSEELKRKSIAKAKRKSNRSEPAEPVASSAADDDSLFAASPTPPARSPRPAGSGAHETAPNRMVHLTPTTSFPLLSPADEIAHGVLQVDTPESYHLFAHLNSKGYYMIPGLRFGAHYSVYPGDPFRFHAHFLALSLGWDEELPMLDLVSRGRLGTGVKKAFLIGGRPPAENGIHGSKTGRSEGDEPGDEVRTFSVEWAAM
jgi:tRNA-splicing endonuclease subunit Sen34